MYGTQWNIRVIVNIVTAFVFLAAAVLVVILVNINMRRQALMEAEFKARLLLEHNLAIHSFFARDLKPKLFELSEPFRGEDYFEPVWMSSTYAIRIIKKYFDELTDTDYYYKECAINARSPENEADEYEKSFLSDLNTNPKLLEQSDIRRYNGQPYFVFLRRGETMEESCLRCHSEPANAPRQMIDRYGADRSFQRHVGEVVSAVSLRIPLSEAYREAGRFSWALSSLLLLLLGFLFLFQYWLNRRFLFAPLSSIRDEALKISTGESHLGKEIPLPFGKELREFAQAFNAMSLNLRHHMDHLEDKIRERAANLLNANKLLTQEMEQRRRMERELKDNEARYRELFHNMGSGAAVYRAEDDGGDFIFVDMNEAGAKSSQVQRDRIVGQSVKDVFPGVCQLGLFEVFQKVWKSGKPIRHPLSLYSDERISQWVENYVYKLPNDEIIAIYDDVTEKMKAEQALRESEHWYRTLFNSASDAIFIHDLFGSMLDVNRAACDSLQYNREELLGLLLQDIVEEGIDKNAPKAFDELRRNGCLFFEAKHRRKNGDVFPVEVKSCLVEYSGKQAALSIARDITERKRMEARLIEAQKMEAVGRLAGGVAHEFNNSMMAVIGYSTLALQKLDPSDPLYQDLNDVLNEGNRAAAITRHLLAFSRKQIIQLKRTNLNDLLNDMKGMLRLMVKDDVEIIFHLDSELGLIDADRGQVEHAIVNLILNAREAMPQGGKIFLETKNVSYREEDIPSDEDIQPGDYVILTVADSGCGIDREIMPRIFEPFFTTKGVGQGPGLGLSTVYGIVKQIGGGVRVESETGKGTKFTIILPRKDGNRQIQ
ncbi:MAG: DUF3365 domain-containing protein [Candidatus Omnitrophota bacterium]